MIPPSSPLAPSSQTQISTCSIFNIEAIRLFGKQAICDANINYPPGSTGLSQEEASL